MAKYIDTFAVIIVFIADTLHYAPNLDALALDLPHGGSLLGNALGRSGDDV